jgi:molybdate transport system substrate-binding protein
MTACRTSAVGRRRWASMLVVLLVATGASCGDDEAPRGAAATSTTEAPATTATTAKPVSGDIVVLAAASLTEAFSEVEAQFEEQYPGTDVKFSFDSSSSLAAQANQGAPADVFVSADEVNMKKVTDTGAATTPETFVRNRLAILVAKGNPKDVAGLDDLENVVYVLCAVGVPCGTYGEQALTSAGVDIETDPPRSREANVKGVVTRVTTGEADAGIVYVTDAKASAKNADTVDIPDEHNVTAGYPMAALQEAPNPAGAAAFMAFLLSGTGQEILVSFGFLPAA